MKAVYIKEFGGVENLETSEVADPPQPKGCEVLARVKAAGLNRADILQRMGLYPPPVGYPERIPGLEFAGVIEAVGDDVKNCKIGARVFGITAGGAQAELLLTREDQLAEIPDNLNFQEAAAVPEAFITAHDALFTQAQLQKGETLLIHAVGSGVGLAGLQLAKAVGAKVIGTSRTKEKLDRGAEFGLDNSIIVEDGTDIPGIVKEITGGKGADVILDLVGAKYFGANLKSLAAKGRLMLVGLTAGRKAEFDLGLALAKRATIKGTVLRSRDGQEKASATAKFTEAVLPLLSSGKIKPNLDRVFALLQARAAHEYLESNASFGKVVLDLL